MCYSAETYNKYLINAEEKIVLKRISKNLCLIEEKTQKQI